MALKHGHGFRLDHPGTDSYRLREEGKAERVFLVGPEDLALMGDWGPGGEPGVTRLAAEYLAAADVVVVEGWKRAPLSAIEVRTEMDDDRPALYRPDSPDGHRFLAVVTADDSETTAGGPRVFSLDDPALAAHLADVVERRVIPGTRWTRGDS